MAAGVIYILTNPSFKEYVKIGYATDLEKRLKQLNRSASIPFAFRVYAVYETDGKLNDKEVHKLIGKSRHISGKAADIAGAFTKTNTQRNKVKAFWYSLPKSNFCYHGTKNMGNAVHCDVR